jgi:hypothetical protein
MRLYRLIEPHHVAKLCDTKQDFREAANAIVAMMRQLFSCGLPT